MYRKGWIVALSLAVAVSLAGCGGAKSASGGQTADQASASASSSASTSNQGGGKEVPKNFPKDIPIPEGAILSQSDFIQSSMQDEIDITYSIDMSVKDLVALYEDAMKKSGYAVTSTDDNGDVTLLGMSNKGNLAVDCKPDPDHKGKSAVYISLAAASGSLK